MQALLTTLHSHHPQAADDDEFAAHPHRNLIVVLLLEEWLVRLMRGRARVRARLEELDAMSREAAARR